MTFNFKNLDDTTRKMMLEEFTLDQNSENLAKSPRLLPDKENEYFGAFIESLQNGNEHTLSQNILKSKMLKKQETSTSKTGKTIVKDVRHDAHEFLAESDFNRFYMRALCKRAIDEKCEVKIYRAKETQEHRETSDEIVGLFVNPITQLDFLRMNPKDYWARKEESNDITEYKIARSGSGLSLELISA